MSKVPDNWVCATIGEITMPFETAEPSKTPERIFTYIDIGAIDNSRQEITDPKTITGTSAPSRARRVVRSGDTLFSTVRTYLRNVALVSHEFDGALTSTGIAVLRPHSDVSPRYLFHWAKSDAFIAAVGQSEDGTLYPAVKDSDVSTANIPLAPRAEQRRIVAKLDSLSARSARARHELDLIPKLIERYKQAILAKAFSGELTADWRAKHKAKNAANFIAEQQQQFSKIALEAGRGRDEKSALLVADVDLISQLQTISTESPLPETWAWAGLGQAFGIYVGATPSRKVPTYWGGNVNWVSSGEVAFCRVISTAERITDEGLKNASTRIHPPGSVLLGMIGEGKTRGQAAILDIPACNNQNCAAIRVSQAGYPPEYVYWYLYLAYESTRRTGAGNNQPALNKDRVQRLPIPLAPAIEAVEIAGAITSAFAWLDNISTEHARARHLLLKLDQAILSKAFRGELVPQDPKDEPASVLLKRISTAPTAPTDSTMTLKRSRKSSQ